MTVKELKQTLGAETSEELFGIEKQPEQTCPKIDQGIRDWRSVRKDIESYCRDLQRVDELEDAMKIGQDIEWAIGTLEVDLEFEILRRQCESIRLWGQEWKNLALKLIEKQEDISGLLSDEFYLKFTEKD